MRGPRFPLYIPSRSRAATATTPRFLDKIGVPYRLVVEADQLDEYAAQFDPAKLVVLDPEYKVVYDSCDPEGDAKGVSKGSGPVRNFIWDHAIAEGAAWHWICDDNITLFARLHQNERIPVGDGMIFHAMEEFCLRYRNVAMGGPQYWMFAPSRAKLPPYVTGVRIFSCNLIRNDIPFRWRGRYNEDLDLSIRILKAGWLTVRFNAFLQYKLTTQTVGGGNTEAFYGSEGTLPKSQMIVRLHPDMTRLAWRYNRWHHDADFSRFRDLALIRDPDYVAPEGDPYRSVKIDRKPRFR